MKKLLLGVVALLGVGAAAYARKQKEVRTDEDTFAEGEKAEKKLVDIFADVKDGVGLLGRDIAGAIEKGKESLGDVVKEGEEKTDQAIEDIKEEVASITGDEH